jgi:hypothetical protein
VKGVARRRTGPVTSAILKDDIFPGGILNETIARVTDILGDELNAFLDRLAEGGAAPHLLGTRGRSCSRGCRRDKDRVTPNRRPGESRDPSFRQLASR